MTRHCGTCGNVLCEYYGQRKVYAGMTDSNKVQMITPARFTLRMGCGSWIPEAR